MLELNAPAFALTVYAVPPLPLHVDRLNVAAPLTLYTARPVYVSGEPATQVSGTPLELMKYAVPLADARGRAGGLHEDRRRFIDPDPADGRGPTILDNAGQKHDCLGG